MVKKKTKWSRIFLERWKEKRLTLKEIARDQEQWKDIRDWKQPCMDQMNNCTHSYTCYFSSVFDALCNLAMYITKHV